MNSKRVTYLTKEVLNNLNKTIVVIDVETTGFSQYNDRIIEFGAVKLVDGKEVDSMSILINPRMHIHSRASEVNHIYDYMVENEPDESYYAPKIFNFFKGAIYVVGHNVSFDLRFLEEMFKRNGLTFYCEYIDTLEYAKVAFMAPNYKLSTLAEYLNIDTGEEHRALSDVQTTIMLLRHITYVYVSKGLV